MNGNRNMTDRVEVLAFTVIKTGNKYAITGRPDEIVDFVPPPRQDILNFVVDRAAAYDNIDPAQIVIRGPYPNADNKLYDIHITRIF